MRVGQLYGRSRRTGKPVDPPAQVGHNADVPRKTLAAAFLLLATAMAPGFAWVGAHLAEVLVHGHEHQEGTPDHQHNLLPSPAIRQDAPRSAQPPAAALLETWPGEIRPLSGTFSSWKPAGPAGPSPPILHLLCTLLI